ncbi:spidroin-2-like [Saccostrea cucullata]|uniref:spidroin-2-like n=1 Tax=Saccostrea cuccullata TaxID=36930 RepID=UPI002ED4447A
MIRFCIATLLVACVAAGSYGVHKPVHHGPVHGPVGHGPVLQHGSVNHGSVHLNPFARGPGLQHSPLWNALNNGRRTLSGSGGHISKSLTHHGKSIHVNDGRNTATATHHHDGSVSANVLPNHVLGQGIHPSAVRTLGQAGRVGSLGPVGAGGPLVGGPAGPLIPGPGPYGPGPNLSGGLIAPGLKRKGGY